MSSTRAIAHNTIVQIIGKIISIFLGLLAIGMMTRYLGQEKFGWYTTANSFLLFVGILIDLGLTTVSAQMLGAAEEKNYRSIFQNLLGFRAITAIIFYALIPITTIFLPYNHETKIAILLFTLAFLAVSMNQVLIGFYQSKLKMYVTAFGESIGRLILIILLWFFISRDSGFLPIVWAAVVGSLIYTAVIWAWAFKFDRPIFGFDWPVWKQIFHNSWPIAISIIFNVIYLKGDIILLSLYRPQAEVGLYGAAYRVIDILSQTAMMIMGVMLPLLSSAWAKKQNEEFKHKYKLAFNVMMVFAVPICVGAGILSYRIMYLVGGSDFTYSGLPLRILSIAVFGVYLGAIFGHLAVAINRQKQTMWIYISDAILTLIGYLIFIPKYGINGAAWMTVFSELYAGILLFATFYYYSRVKLYLGNFFKIIFSATIMAITLWIFASINLILLTILGALVYSVCLLISGGISKDTLREVLTLHPKN